MIPHHAIPQPGRRPASIVSPPCFSHSVTAAGAADATTKPSILKMDDLTQRGADKAKGEAVSGNFTAFIDTIRKMGLKASLGIIGNSLEDGSPEYYAWIKALHDEGLVEFWNHGYNHQESPKVNGRRRTEFAGASLEEQIESLGKTQRLAKEKLGLDLKAFGSPFNQIDGTTVKAMDAFPEITSWFYGPPQATTDSRRSLERRMDLESPVLKPNSAQLIEAFNAFGKDLQYIVLQGHPNSWGGKQRAEFVKAVQFLKDQGCVFMTPSEFLSVKLRAPTLPSAPGKPKTAAPTASPAPVSAPLPEPSSNPNAPESDASRCRRNGSPTSGTAHPRAGIREKLADNPVVPAHRASPRPEKASSPTKWSPCRRGGPITGRRKSPGRNRPRRAGLHVGAVQMMSRTTRARSGDYLSVETFKRILQGWKTVGRPFPVCGPRSSASSCALFRQRRRARHRLGHGRLRRHASRALARGACEAERPHDEARRHAARSRRDARRNRPRVWRREGREPAGRRPVRLPAALRQHQQIRTDPFYGDRPALTKRHPRRGSRSGSPRWPASCARSVHFP